MICFMMLRVGRIGRRRISAAVLCCCGALRWRRRGQRRAVRPERCGARFSSDCRRATAPHWDAIRDAARRARSAARHASAAPSCAHALSRAVSRRKAIRASSRTRSARSRRGTADAAPPLEIALERALIAQTEHRFDAARAELERVTRARAARGAGVAHARRDRYRARPLRRTRTARAAARVARRTRRRRRLPRRRAGDDAARPRRRIASSKSSLARPESLDARIAAWLETLAAETADALGLA